MGNGKGNSIILFEVLCQSASMLVIEMQGVNPICRGQCVAGETSSSRGGEKRFRLWCGFMDRPRPPGGPT